MYFYFSASVPTVLKINGIYIGRIDCDGKKINLDCPDNTFIEILSVGEAFDGINFFLSDFILESPPKKITVTNLGNGYHINCNLSATDNSFKILNQTKMENAVATVFSENGLKLSLENEYGGYFEQLQFTAEEIKIQAFPDNQNLIAVIGEGELKFINVYRFGNEDSPFVKVFENSCIDYSLSPDFSIIKKYYDIKKHVVNFHYTFNGDTFTQTNRNVESQKTIRILDLPRQILPYAFIEDLLVGDSIDEYLDTQVLNNKDKLKEYFGNFIGVMPPKTQLEQNTVGLIYKQKENLFKVEYFTFTINGYKIENVKKI